MQLQRKDAAAFLYPDDRDEVGEVQDATKDEDGMERE